MADTTYIDRQGPVVSAAWLNDVNNLAYHGALQSGTAAPLRIGLGLTAASGASLIGYSPSGSSAAVTVEGKLREVVSVKDFGALGDVGDDTAALQAMVTYVNGILNNDRWPIGIYWPQGYYRYTQMLAFTRPVHLFSDQRATLDYTGSEYAVKLGPDGLSGSNIQLNAEYGVDGLRFENCLNCLHVIYINELVTEPRIRNVTFIDCGNSTSFCIYAQYGNWSTVIENCRLLVLNGAGGMGLVKFAGLARSPTGAAPYAIDDTGRTGYDGGNSRVTIRDCWMSSFLDQSLGPFAVLSAAKSRIVGGGFQHSTYGIYLTGFASATTIDSVYGELSSAASQSFIYAESTLTSGALRFYPENVVARNCYVNMKSDVQTTARVVKSSDSGMRFKGWRLEDFTISNIVDGGGLVTQPDVAGQTGNYIDVRILSIDVGTKKFLLRDVGYNLAEPWQTRDGLAVELVGDAAYTLTQADVGRTKMKNGTVVRNWTLPSDTTAPIEVGSVVYVFHGGTTNPVFLIADAGVTVILAGTNTVGTRTLAPNGLARCLKGASNVWYVDGPGVT